LAAADVKIQTNFPYQTFLIKDTPYVNKLQTVPWH